MPPPKVESVLSAGLEVVYRPLADAVPFSRSTSLLVVAAGLCTALSVQAAEDVCATSRATALVAEESGSLRSARVNAQMCAAETCAPAVREECATILQRVDEGLANLTVAVVDTHGQPIANTLVQVGGQSLAPEETVALDPGDYIIVIETPDGRHVQKAVLLTRGETKRESIIVMAEGPSSGGAGALPYVPPAVAADAPVGTGDFAKPSTAVNRSDAALYHGLGLLGATVGFVGLGIGAYYGLLDHSRRVEANCANGHCANAATLATYKSAESAGTTSTIFLASGAVVGGVGLALWYFAPALATVKPVDVVGRGHVTASFAPLLGTKESGMMLRGEF